MIFFIRLYTTPLKSKANHETAFNVVLNTGLRDYLETKVCCCAPSRLAWSLLPKADSLQNNFGNSKLRPNFIPPKNYVFSRSDIQTHYAKVASVIIVSIVTAIATSQNVAHPLPRVPQLHYVANACFVWDR